MIEHYWIVLNCKKVNNVVQKLNNKKALCTNSKQ